MPSTIDYDPSSDRLVLRFAYDPVDLAKVKAISGKRYVPPEKGGPAWTIPASLDNAREARRIFGPALRLTEEAKEWGTEQKALERNLLSVHGADNAELTILPKENPKLYKFIKESDPPRPYQLADIAFMAQTSCINACEPSLGKTIETIGAIYEADLIGGSHLVVAPVTTLEDTWADHFRTFCDDDLHIYVAHGDMRDVVLQQALDQEEAFVVITNPDTVRRKHEVLRKFSWTTIIVDEFHLSGLSSPKNAGNGKGTVFFKTILELEAKRKWALSGTPIGGKPVRLWPAFHFFAPSEFSSKWSWVDRWLETEISATRNGNFKKALGIRNGLEEEFYSHHRRFLIRRTKLEVRKELPKKLHVDVWCDLTPTQEKQYKAMATETEIRIDEENLTANNVLALYTRLKQFATARQEIVKVVQKEGHDYPTLVLYPTYDSGKLPSLIEHLAERGIDEEMEGDAGVIIGSQFRPWCDVIHRYLTEVVGIPEVGLITGKVPREERQRAVRAFEKTKTSRVVVMQTKTGGVGLNMDRAESVHIMDETWNPDDQSQLADRGHRFTGVTIYTYRSRRTIEEYIQQIGIDKSLINDLILDYRRRGLIHG